MTSKATLLQETTSLLELILGFKQQGYQTDWKYKVCKAT